MWIFLATLATAAADTRFYGLNILPVNTTYPQADVSYLPDGQLAVLSSGQVFMSVYDSTLATISGYPVGVSTDGFANLNTTVGTSGWVVRTLDVDPYSAATIVIYNGVFQFWLCANAEGQSYGSEGTQFPLAVGRSAPAECINPVQVYLQANDYTDYYNSLSSQYAAASTSIDFSLSLTGTYSASITSTNDDGLLLQTDSSTLITTDTSASVSGTAEASAITCDSSTTSANNTAAATASSSRDASTEVSVASNSTNAAAAHLAWPVLAVLGLTL